MFKIRKSNQRGIGEHGWLHSKHSFSFAGYYDEDHMGFRSLRVINEDRIDGGTGFGQHSHRDMEIISYVVSGALEHKDSMGNATVISPDEVQRMSAGTGVAHSEYNKMQEDQAHFFQIWIQPNQLGIAPGYAQKSFRKELSEQDKVLVISPEGRDGSLPIKQDAEIFISRLAEGKKISHDLRKGRGLWLQVVTGSLLVQMGAESANLKLETGDGLEVTDETNFEVKALKASEFLIFDLA
jgi:redox-sensitive bicupin YhaK (pirin superfamily)